MLEVGTTCSLNGKQMVHNAEENGRVQEQHHHNVTSQAALLSKMDNHQLPTANGFQTDAHILTAMKQIDRFSKAAPCNSCPCLSDQHLTEWKLQKSICVFEREVSVLSSKHHRAHKHSNIDIVSVPPNCEAV